MPELSSTGLVAAIDLGSNSFRLEICQAGEGQLQRVEYLKDTVRLGAGLDDMRQLDDAAMSRGWTSVARFAERVRDLEPRAVRAVATATLREALNREAFLSRAQSLLGLPIDVISGHEEARLIYGGVASGTMVYGMSWIFGIAGSLDFGAKIRVRCGESGTTDGTINPHTMLNGALSILYWRARGKQRRHCFSCRGR